MCIYLFIYFYTVKLWRKLKIKFLIYRIQYLYSKYYLILINIFSLFFDVILYTRHYSNLTSCHIKNYKIWPEIATRIYNYKEDMINENVEQLKRNYIVNKLNYIPLLTFILNIYITSQKISNNHKFQIIL